MNSPARITRLRLARLALTALAAACALSASAQTYTTSWIGNSFGWQNQKWMQQNLSALWVRSDGTVFTNSQYDEGQQSCGIYKDGQVVGKLQDITLSGGRVITGDSNYVWVSIEGIVRRHKHDGTKAPYPDGVDYWTPGDGSDYVTRGLAVVGNELFLSDASGVVRVYDKNTRAQLRTWALARPGKIAVAPDQSLWIIQRKDASNAGRVIHSDRNGGQLGQVITHAASAWDPVGVCFDPSGRLLVADDGPDQQIKIYSSLGISRTSPDATFGATGGILSGVRGQVAPLKFNGLTDVGADAAGNIYVAQDRFGPDLGKQGHGAGAILESYTSSGTRRWQLHGLEFVDGADLDRSSISGSQFDVYTKLSRYRVDLSKTAPGTEYTYAGHTLDRFRYPNDPRLRRQSQNGDFTYTAFVRTLAGKKFVFNVGMWSRFLECYRFNAATDGEIAIPAMVFNRGGDNGYGAYVNNPTNGEWIWVDANGNGNMDANEFVSNAGQYPNAWGWWVDTNGDIWRTAENRIDRYPFQGLNASGAPQWNFATRVQKPTPALFSGANGNMRRIEVYPDINNGTAYISGYQEWPGGGTDDKEMGSKLACYDNWNTSSPTLRWAIDIPWSKTVTTDIPEGMTVAEDYVFIVYSGFSTNSRESQIRVFRTSDGAYAGQIAPGPEVGNHSGAADIPYGIRAWKRSATEYIVFVEEDNNAKVLMYHWNPAGSGAPIGKKIALKAAVNGSFVSNDMNDSNRLKAASASPGEWEQYEVVDAGAGKIGLRSLVNNLYVSADQNQSYILRAAWATGIGDWEKFTWEPLGGGSIALRAGNSGLYVSANIDNGGVLQASWAGSVGSWEQFSWQEITAPVPIGKTIGIRATANGRFASNNTSNNNLIMANWATGVGDWEKFDVVDAGSGKIGLRARNNGLFVSNHMNWNNRLVAGWATSVGDWEKFEWAPLDNGRFALRSSINGLFVTSDQNDGGIFKADRATTAGGWEEFEWQQAP